MRVMMVRAQRKIVIFSSHGNVYYLRMFWQSEQQQKYNISYPLVFEFDSFWSDAFAAYISDYLSVFICIVLPELSPFICDENRYLFIYLVFDLIASDTPCVGSTIADELASSLFW
eukprot:345198_1